MLLLEHEGKELLRSVGIATPQGTILYKDHISLDNLVIAPLPAVVKAQVPVGGRGKAGGIVKINTFAELEATVSRLFKTTLKDFAINRLLVEEQKLVRQEYYLAVIFDGEDQLLLIGARGGVDVESYYGAERDTFATVPVDPIYGLSEYRLRDALATLSVNRKLWSQFNDIAYRLVRMFRTYDATLAEINPLAEIDDGSLSALDARVIIDDGALFRQPQFNARKAPENSNALAKKMRDLQIQYVPLGGPIGLIGSGAGCGVAIMDWVAHEGSKLAAFIDMDYTVLSGQTEAGLRLVLDYWLAELSIRSILVNFTACGVRVDLIAEALAKVLSERARKELKPLFTHFQGNRSLRARKIMRDAGYPTSDRLGDAVRGAVAEAQEP